jgi:hypothetical protein
MRNKKVCKGLFRVAIVFVIFRAAQTKVETIVFAMLVMIYYTIVGTSYSESLASQAEAMGIDSQFRGIRGILKEDLPNEGREDGYAQRRDIVKTSGRSRVRFWISAIFLGMI